MKNDRQNQLLQIISEEIIETQEQLLEELRDAGALALADTPQAVAEALQKLGY